MLSQIVTIKEVFIPNIQDNGFESGSPSILAVVIYLYQKIVELLEAVSIASEARRNQSSHYIVPVSKDLSGNRYANWRVSRRNQPYPRLTVGWEIKTLRVKRRGIVVRHELGRIRGRVIS
jgi:hypothetical protein